MQFDFTTILLITLAAVVLIILLKSIYSIGPDADRAGAKTLWRQAAGRQPAGVSRRGRIPVGNAHAGPALQAVAGLCRHQTSVGAGAGGPDRRGDRPSRRGLPIGAKSAVYKPEFGNFADLKVFIEKGGQKGVQRPVLSPGTLAPIHPVAFLVITQAPSVRRAGFVGAEVRWRTARAN